MDSLNANMPSYGAKWYPGPSSDPVLNLSAEELATITKNAKGTPVTYNHLGIFDSVSKNKTFQELAKENPQMGEIGTVTDAFVIDGTGYCVFETKGPMVSTLTGTAAAPAVSLSHAQTPNGLRALELTLTQTPARENANIEVKLGCDSTAQEYIAWINATGKTQTMSSLSAEPDTATAPPVEADAEMTDCERALNTLSEEHRKVRLRTALPCDFELTTCVLNIGPRGCAVGSCPSLFFFRCRLLLAAWKKWPRPPRRRCARSRT